MDPVVKAFIGIFFGGSYAVASFVRLVIYYDQQKKLSKEYLLSVVTGVGMCLIPLLTL